METDRRSAMAALAEVSKHLLEIRRTDLDRPVRVETLLETGETPLELQSTLGRELSFVISHTIHHNAVIGVFARTMDVSLPADFGFAPSTVAHRQLTTISNS